MKISADFITSAATPAALPRDGLPQVALVGRSNVGKSSLINALVRSRVARTSAAPGKTRLANVYRVQRGANPALYLVDLPGFGFAPGSEGFEQLAATVVERAGAAVLLVDARHPGLANDGAAWEWLRRTVEDVAIVATKIDKLARGERIRALKELESVFHVPVLPVSAVTGEGLEELWKLIEQLPNNNSRNSSSRNSSSARSRPRAAGTAPPPRRR